MTERFEEEEYVVAAIRLHGRTQWYRAPRELFVMNYVKWRSSFVAIGHDISPLDESDRGGIHIVDSSSVDRFISFMSPYKIDADQLSVELAKRYQTAESWWDVSDLFPISYIDFDSCHVSAFYPSGTPMEKFLPEGWTGEFKDFATERGTGSLADQDKFWIKGDVDLLTLLNERGSKNKR